MNGRLAPMSIPDPYNPEYVQCFQGGDPVSTWALKHCRACRGVEHLVNPTANNLVANDDNYALAA